MSFKREMSQFHFLAYLSTYIKNSIIFSSQLRNTDKIHIKTITDKVNRRLDRECKRFNFFKEGAPLLVQLLEYLEQCGEIKHLGHGYYTVFPERNIVLPNSKKLINVGCLKKEALGLIKEPTPKKNIKNEEVIFLADYRYDLSYSQWIKIYNQSRKEISFQNEEYYKPSCKRYIRIYRPDELIDEELYHVISYPFENKRDHFIAKRINGKWYGERINNYFQKSILSLLVEKGYRPFYTTNRVSKYKSSPVYRITLSDYLPNIEKEQLYLFSSPQRLFHNKVFFVKEEFIKDFIYVLKKLKFEERTVGT